MVVPFGGLRAGENDEERNAFNWKNLQSDIAGVADRTDPNLVNSWGDEFCVQGVSVGKSEDWRANPLRHELP